MQNNDSSNQNDAEEFGVQFEHSDNAPELNSLSPIVPSSDIPTENSDVTSDIDEEVIPKPKNDVEDFEDELENKELPKVQTEETNGAEFGQFGEIKSNIVLDLDHEDQSDSSDSE